MSSVKILWDNWNKYDMLDSVFRQGFIKVRVYGEDPDIKWLIRKYHAESTLTHSGRAAMLFSDMMDLWPTYYKGVDKYAALKVALNHDIGELIVGDVCDDGCAEHEDKKEPEWGAIVYHYSQFQDENYLKYKDIHQQFEDTSTFLGQSIKLADKLDFVAKLIKLEGEGVKFTKSTYFSEKDWELAKEIHVRNFVDIVANHLRHLLKDGNFDQRLVLIAEEFLACGLASANRPFFNWWHRPMKF